MTRYCISPHFGDARVPSPARPRPQEPGAGLWAWLFAHAPELTEVPADLPNPFRKAVALANEATFTSLELDAYRRAMDEIQQAREYGEEKEAKGKAEGLAEGLIMGKAAAILAVLRARGIPVDDSLGERIEACSDPNVLDRWIARAATARSALDVVNE